MKQYKSKFIESGENEVTFPAPEGFKKTYTGGNIYKYEGTLPNGKYVELFGEQDIQEEDSGFVVGETNVAHLYNSKDLEHEDVQKESVFKTKEELDSILSKWGTEGTLFEGYKRLFT